MTGPLWTVALYGSATDDRTSGSGTLVGASTVLTSLSVAATSDALWVTFPAAGAVRRPVIRIREGGGLAVLTLASPAPRAARPTPAAFPGSLLGERWEAGGLAAYGVITAVLPDGRVRLETRSPARLSPAEYGGGLWSPRLEAVVAVIDGPSTARPLSGVRELLAGRAEPTRRNGNAGAGGRSWSAKAVAGPARVWRPGPDGGPVESEQPHPGGSPVDGEGTVDGEAR